MISGIYGILIARNKKDMKAMALPALMRLEKTVIAQKFIFYNLGLISLGSIIYVYGLNSILVPQGFLNGGIVGISILIHYLIPVAGIGSIYILLNIPLVFMGWMHVSRTFMLYTLFGILFFSVITATFHPKALVISDHILAALLAGVLCGAGDGIILRSMGSAGGLDILSVYLNKKFGLRIGSIFFASNALVLTAGAFLYDVDRALYSIVFLYTSGRVMDAIITGFNKRKSLLVISDYSQDIADTILKKKGRGVTFLNGEGAFTQKARKVLFTITTLIELPKMKELILSIDPDALIVVNDTLEVLRKQHGQGREF